jgi:ParB-like nuclease domain
VTATVLPHRYEMVSVASLVPHPDNANQGDVAGIAESIEGVGFWGAVLVHEATGRILAGEHRWRAAQAAGLGELPAIVITCDEDTARAILLGDNEWARRGVWDQGKLVALLQRQQATPLGLVGSGFTAANLAAMIAAGTGAGGPVPTLADRFLAPPFDVLDGRAGWWRERKARWLALGFASELGRLDGAAGARAMTTPARSDPAYYAKKATAEAALGHPLTAAEFQATWYQAPTAGLATGKSIFDPVLCELVLRWFVPPGGAVLDPFAGGSVRGLMAAMLGHPYSGCDLAAAQVAANEQQAADFAARGLLAAAGAEDAAARSAPPPRWACADAAQWVGGLAPGSADLVFTCPPYYGLERYSDDPHDLSAMPDHAFDAAYGGIIAGAGRALAPDRFAVVVTGDVRDGRGRLRDLRGVTITAAASAGLGYVSGAVLLTAIGSLPFAAARAFTGTRTLLRAHQDVLVFCKGDRRAAAQACGDVRVELPPEAA